ncbi:DUF3800 domain-containing protein [Subtercola lobariae]|uniref:DUF3800 domain-containing protein n=1 Tax=Subtercola lobariae TaxID=1588641 RepID=UPI001665728F
MLAFIDDSGDPGFKVAQGSSPFLVMAACVFTDNLEIERTAASIADSRTRLAGLIALSFTSRNAAAISESVFSTRSVSTSSSSAPSSSKSLRW